MGNERRRIVITRLMQVAVVLHESKRGLTVRQLMQRLERSKVSPGATARVGDAQDEWPTPGGRRSGESAE